MAKKFGNLQIYAHRVPGAITRVPGTRISSITRAGTRDPSQAYVPLTRHQVVLVVLICRRRIVIFCRRRRGIVGIPVLAAFQPRDRTHGRFQNRGFVTGPANSQVLVQYIAMDRGRGFFWWIAAKKLGNCSS